MSDYDELAQTLAEWCEMGILERPRVIDGDKGVKYRFTEKARKGMAHVIHHPELFSEEQQQKNKELFEKLAPIFREDEPHQG
jgi:hypothetical protein